MEFLFVLTCPLVFDHSFLVYCCLQIEKWSNIRTVSKSGVKKIVAQVNKEGGWDESKPAIVMMPGIFKFIDEDEDMTDFELLTKAKQMEKVMAYIAQENRPDIQLIEGAHR